MPSDKAVTGKGTNQFVRMGHTDGYAYGMGITMRPTNGSNQPPKDLLP